MIPPPLRPLARVLGLCLAVAAGVLAIDQVLLAPQARDEAPGRAAVVVAHSS